MITMIDLVFAFLFGCVISILVLYLFKATYQFGYCTGYDDAAKITFMIKKRRK